MAANGDTFETDTVESPQSQAFTDFLGVVRRRKSLVALGLVTGLVIGTLYYVQQSPVYRSDAQVLVIKKQPDAMPLTGADSRLSYYEDYLSTHQVLITSPLIIGKAIEKPELRGLSTLAGVSDATKLIKTSLTVTREKDTGGTNSTNILNLSFRGKASPECGVILNGVIDSYKEFLDDTYKKVNDNSHELITKARDILQRDLAEKEKEYAEFREDAPLWLKGKEGANVHVERLANIEARRAVYLVRRTELQGRLNSIDKALKEGRSREALIATLPDLPTRPGEASRHSGATLEDHLLPLLQQEQALMEDFGSDHPQLVALRHRIQVTRDFFAKPASARGQAPGSDVGDDAIAGLDPLELYVRSVKQELKEIDVSDQLFDELSRSEEEAARKLTKLEVKGEALRSAIAQLRQLCDTTINRLKEVNLVREYGGFDARIIAPASAGWKVEPRAVPIFTAAALLGLLGGIGLAYLADRSDRSFRTPEEIRRRLGLPVVGHIPLITVREEELPAAEAGRPQLDPVLCTYFRSQSHEAESYRGVRTALYFSMHGKQHKVIQITSPSMGDGKTTLAANLGISIAQSGKRTVLIDADFRRPRLHKLFGLSARVGLASVIDGEAELMEAIQESAVEGLSLIPCGPVPPNPAELLTSPRFKELLEAIREQYDFVIVDTPPLLAVTDPCVVAPRVDGVLLNIRVSKNARPNAERAKEILNTLGVTVVGIVVNGLDGGSGSEYGYAHYQYNYGYANGYHAREGDDSRPQNGDVSPDGAGGAGDGGEPLAAGDKPANGRRRQGRGRKSPQGFINRLFHR
jgi:capsular exopolysaccharide synthesis family protein